MKNHQWLESVLADLTCYAELNDLTELTAKLEVARRVACVEISGCETVRPISKTRQTALEQEAE